MKNLTPALGIRPFMKCDGDTGTDSKCRSMCCIA
jgi:hypothetical protein